MYIDARKHDYKNIDATEAAQAIARDKVYARAAYIKWFESNADKIIDRLWEIDDIGIVEKIGDFVKLLKEAEFTYSLGAYQSSIALVGVSAEDFCKFFANDMGSNLDKLTQNDRIDKLHRNGFIDKATSDQFHEIRKLRNDCLHFNEGFKKKSEALLKSDARRSVNLLKEIYSKIIGATSYNSIDAKKLIEIIELTAKEGASGSSESVINMDDATIRFRNIFSKVTGVDLSVNFGNEYEFRFSIYLVDEIDLETEPKEITLVDKKNGLPFIVDLTNSDIENLQKENIVAGHLIMAAVVSETNGLGMTAIWKFASKPLRIS